jgi:hypothetical protein
MIENALGVIDGVGRDKFFYFNVALDISETCDCAPFGPLAIAPDIGIFASRDPVAIDAASIAKLNEAQPVVDSACGDLEAGEDKLAIATPWPDPHTGQKTPTQCHNQQIEYGQKLGLGTEDYELIEADEKPKP